MVPDEMKESPFTRAFQQSPPERRRQFSRFLRISTGLAGAFAAVCPGLGHLFLRQYGYAAVFAGAPFGAWVTLQLQLRNPSTANSVLAWYPFLTFAAILYWLFNIAHAIYTAHVEAQRAFTAGEI